MAKTPQHERLEMMIGRTILNHPFYGSILLSLRIQEGTPAELPFPTMGTDGRRLLYSSSFVDSCNDLELVGVLVHEAAHIAALHPIRRELRVMMPWNVAADMEINKLIENEGLTLPANCVPGKEGIAEEFYAEMKTQSMKCQCGCGGEGKEQEGEGGEGQSPHSGWMCQHFDAEPRLGETLEEMRSEMVENIRKANTYAKMCGKEPQGMKRWLDELLIPKLKWDEVLRRFVETKFEPATTWDSPNRRYLHRNIILAGRGRKRTIAEVVWGIDTSGSIGGPELLRAVSEVRGCLEECYSLETKLPVVWFDSEAYLDYVERDTVLEPKGGGGTDFSAVMRCVEQNELTETCKGLIIITDGYCGSFGEKPPVPVLWLVFGEYAESFKPPFGDVTRLEIV